MKKSFVNFVFCLFTAALPLTILQAQKTTLFKPGKKGDWYIYLSKKQKDNDTLKVFRF